MGQGWSKRLDDWMSPPQRYNAPPPPPIYPSQPSSSNPPVPYPICPRPYPNGYNYYYQYPWNNFQYHQVNQGPYWRPAPAALPYPSSSRSAPYVDHQQAIKIKNNINLHKDTISLRRDEGNPDQWIVSFTFDAVLDGSITIYYFAKEDEMGHVVPMDPGIYAPVTETFQKGPGQKFCQSVGHGIDLGFFELDSLAKPSPEDVFPLVVLAAAGADTANIIDGKSPTLTDSGAQITFAVIEKSANELFRVKVIKQILWVDGKRYELKEIFGLSGAGNDNSGDDVVGKECVICMSEPSDTAVMPCRHMCMCGECAKTFRLHSNSCPICRHPVEELMEIKVNNG